MKFLLVLAGLVLALPAWVHPTVLGDLAASMKAGEWRELKTNNINPTLGNTGGASGVIIGYTDDIVWDPNTHGLYFIGSDHFHSTGYARFVTYAETTNTWRELPRPIWFQPLTETAMHGYHHTTINPATGELYHRPMGAKRAVNRYSLTAATWRSGFSLPTSLLPNESDMACCIGVSFFPELKGLVFVDGGGNQNIYEFSTATYKWSMLKSGVPMGAYQSTAEYNPIYKVVVGGGGNGSNALYKIDSLGTVTALKPAPFNIGIEQTIFTVDPVSGDYLVFNNSGQFYTYNVQTDTWRLQAAAPPVFTGSFGVPVHGTAATPVSTYGVVAFVTCESSDSSRVIVYKHSASTGVESRGLNTRGPTFLTVSPNPIASKAMLKLTERNQGPALLRIYDVNGKRVADLSSQAESNPVITWDTRNLPNGIYLLQARILGKYLAQKLLVQK